MIPYSAVVYLVLLRLIYVQIHAPIKKACILHKLKGYSNPAGGHLTFISQWNLTNCRYNYKIMYVY